VSLPVGRLAEEALPRRPRTSAEYFTIEVDIDAELAQLGPTGYRPLRAGDILF
jgi:hypothetical protein